MFPCNCCWSCQVPHPRPHPLPAPNFQSPFPVRPSHVCPSVRLFAQHVYDCWTRFWVLCSYFCYNFCTGLAEPLSAEVHGAKTDSSEESEREMERERERQRETARQFAYFTNKKCNWKGKQFLKFNCDCNSIVTFIDSCIYTHVLRTPPLHACMHILLFNRRWFYYGVLSTLLNFNIAIEFLFYFLFSDWFSLFLLLYFHTAFDNNNHLQPLVVSHRKVSSIMFIFYLPLLWPVKLTKWLTCHEGQRQWGRGERFKCLTDYRLELWLIKDSVYLSCIACKWVYFRQLRIEFVVLFFAGSGLDFN